MRYIILAYEPPNDFEARSGRGRYRAAWRAYIDSMYRAGIIESMHALLADYTATIVRTRDGRRQLHDGPYADTTEQLGGYFVINVANLDRALEWAEKCPAAASGAVEVRPLMQDRLSECIVRPDGSVRWIQGRSFPIRDAGGRPYRVAGIAEDVTAHRESEEQLGQAQKMEVVGRLAGGIAHDFNNLLTVINGYTDLLLTKLSASDQIRAELREIRGAGQRAQELTSQMLAFSRSQIRTTDVLSLHGVIADVVKMLRPMIGEDIEMVTDFDPESGQVNADRTELTQILLNLAANARDAMPKGGTLTFETRNVEIDDSSARYHAGSRPGPHVLLTVTDTGVGMDVETQEHLFEPFFTTKQVGKGTELGLATVYGIVSRCRGWIQVKSDPGRGTTFQIYLPRVENRATEKAERPGPSEQQLHGTETVLVVEDQPHVRKLICAILKEFGYQTLEASDSEEALRLATTHNGPIDLVLTDVIMPGIKGPELANRLKGIRRLRVLFMSGYSVTMEGGHDPEVAYIRKPFTPENLARKVREVLDATEPRPNASGS
jgi:signal transduction histidine kinase